MNIKKVMKFLKSELKTPLKVDAYRCQKRYKKSKMGTIFTVLVN